MVEAGDRGGCRALVREPAVHEERIGPGAVLLHVLDIAHRGAVHDAANDHPQNILIAVPMRQRDHRLHGATGRVPVPPDDILSPLVGHAGQHAVASRSPHHLHRLLLVRHVGDAGARDVVGQHVQVRRDVAVRLEVVGVLADLLPGALHEQHARRHAQRSHGAGAAVGGLRRDLDVRGRDGVADLRGADGELARGGADGENLARREPGDRVQILRVDRVAQPVVVPRACGEVLVVAGHAGPQGLRELGAAAEPQPIFVERHSARPSFAIRPRPPRPASRARGDGQHLHHRRADQRRIREPGDARVAGAIADVGPRHTAIRLGASAVERWRCATGAARRRLVDAALVVDGVVRQVDHRCRPLRVVGLGDHADADQPANIARRENARRCADRDGAEECARRHLYVGDVQILERRASECDLRQRPIRRPEAREFPRRVVRMHEVHHVSRLCEIQLREFTGRVGSGDLVRDAAAENHAAVGEEA